MTLKLSIAISGCSLSVPQFQTAHQRRAAVETYERAHGACQPQDFSVAGRDQHVSTILDHLSARREELDECFTGSPNAVVSLSIHDGSVELARSAQAPWTAEDESVAACLLRTLRTDALPNGRPLFVTAMNHENAYSYEEVSRPAIKAMVAAARAQEGSLRECYSDALRLWPTLEGRVLSRLTYDAQGKVVDAVVLRNETEQTLLGCCAVHVMRTWTMPAWPGDGPVALDIPLVFQLSYR